MQDRQGMMHEIDEEQFKKMMTKGFVSTDGKSKAQRVLKVGDVFKVRNCTFEVSEIKLDGIFAKGIPYAEWLQKRDRHKAAQPQKGE